MICTVCNGILRPGGSCRHCCGSGFDPLSLKSSTFDSINHPSHYTKHPSGVECIQIAEHYGFNIGNCIKYLWRAGLKDGSSDLEDLKKARWYLDREITKRGG